MSGNRRHLAWARCRLTAAGSLPFASILRMSSICARRLVLRLELLQRDQRGRKRLGQDPFVVAGDPFFGIGRPRMRVAAIVYRGFG